MMNLQEAEQIAAERNVSAAVPYREAWLRMVVSFMYLRDHPQDIGAFGIFAHSFGFIRGVIEQDDGCCLDEEPYVREEELELLEAITDQWINILNWFEDTSRANPFTALPSMDVQRTLALTEAVKDEWKAALEEIIMDSLDVGRGIPEC